MAGEKERKQGAPCFINTKVR